VEPADHLRYQTENHPSPFAPFLCSQHLMTLQIVDGRNPAPVDMVNITLFTGFYTSQVVQDFFPSTVCVQHCHGSHIQVTAFHSKDCESSVFFDDFTAG